MFVQPFDDSMTALNMASPHAEKAMSMTHACLVGGTLPGSAAVIAAAAGGAAAGGASGGSPGWGWRPRGWRAARTQDARYGRQSSTRAGLGG